MKPSHLLTGCLVVPVMTAILSCRTLISQQQGNAPKQVTAWTGRPGNLGEWGHGLNLVYGTLRSPGSVRDLLVLWKWEGASMREGAALTLPQSNIVCPVSSELCGLALNPKNKFADWPYALLDLGSNKIIREWNVPGDWWISHAGGSMNGKWIALVLREGIRAPGYDRQKERTKVGLIDVANRALRWVAQLDGHGAGTIRRLCVTDDARYIAVAGWNNGSAMVDAKEGKLLWAKRPKDEVGTGYAAFAPDGKVIYTAGSEGCVYAIEVGSGNVLSRRWATSTGESIYAHRVSALAISGDGKRLAAGTGPEGEVYVWDLAQDSKARVLKHGEGTILIVAFSPDSRNIASVGGGVLKVWELQTTKK